VTCVSRDRTRVGLRRLNWSRFFKWKCTKSSLSLGAGRFSRTFVVLLGAGGG
jgi:hypothetical protein